MVTATIDGLGYEPVEGTLYRVTIDNEDPIYAVSYIDYGRTDEWVAISDATPPDIFYIKLYESSCEAALFEYEEAGTHHIKLEKISFPKIDVKYLPTIYDSDNNYAPYSIIDALNMICKESSLSHHFVDTPSEGGGGGDDPK